MDLPEAATGPEAEAVFTKIMGAVQARNPDAVTNFNKGCKRYGKSPPELVQQHAKQYFDFLVQSFGPEFTVRAASTATDRFFGPFNEQPLAPAHA
jgi:hypothetical protein